MPRALNRKNCIISFDDPNRGTTSLIILQRVSFEKEEKMENGMLSQVQSEAFRSFPILNLQNIKYSCTKDISYYFFVKSTSMMMNDRSCYEKELKIVTFTRELRIHSKIQTFLPEEECNDTRSIPEKKYIHDVLPSCRNI